MSLLINENDLLKEKFLKAPFQLRHGLVDSPLFKLPRIIELAKSMPGDRIEYSSGKLSVSHRPEDIPKIDLPAEEVIRTIEQANAWMVIKGVEDDPEYRKVLESFLAEVTIAAGEDVEPLLDMQSCLFVYTAGSTTPFHMDAEENILLQIRGDKFVHVYDNSDRSLVSEEDMEISPSRHRNRAYDESFDERAEVFSLSDGDAVHIPYMWPHWVRTGDEYTISIAMTWKTPSVLNRNKVRLINGTLRRFKWPQQPPGVHPVLDAVKIGIHDVARVFIDPLRKSEKMRKIIRGLIYGRSANYYYEDSKKGN